MASPVESIVPPTAAPTRFELPALLRGDVLALQGWLTHRSTPRLIGCLVAILLGAGAYGAAIGGWRSPLQGAYTAAKLPLILLLTTLGNALLNGLLAPLLGLNLSLRQTTLAILLSFTSLAVILAAFSPLVFFAVWNLPPMSAEAARGTAYALIQLSQVVVIAFAGIVANVRLLQLLRHLSGSRAIATRVLVAWLAGNLLLGTQLTWMLRPFFGAPALPVEFLRHDALRGNFFEAVAYNLRFLFTD
jgi:hypothetical protein